MSNELEALKVGELVREIERVNEEGEKALVVLNGLQKLVHCTAAMAASRPLLQLLPDFRAKSRRRNVIYLFMGFHFL